jgi:hypothetical protein
VEAGIEGPDADPDLAVGGKRPPVAGGDIAAVDPDLEVVAGTRRMDLQAASPRSVTTVSPQRSTTVAVSNSKREGGTWSQSRPHSAR